MPVSWQTRLLLRVRDVHVAVDRLEHALARRPTSRAARRVERVAQVLRDVLQRPDVQVRGGVLDGALQIGRRRCSCSLRFLRGRPARAAAEHAAFEE